MSGELKEVPADFVTEPRSLGTFPAAYVNRVLYGDLRGAWRTVVAAPDCPDGVRQFLTLSVPPLPLLFAELDEGASYRRAWLIAPGIARVDQPTDDPAVRELLLEPLADLVRDDVAAIAAASTSRLVATFPSDWSRSWQGFTRSWRSTPFAPGRTPRIDLRFEGTRCTLLDLQPDDVPVALPDLTGEVTAQALGAVIEAWIAHWWPQVVGRA